MDIKIEITQEDPLSDDEKELFTKTASVKTNSDAMLVDNDCDMAIKTKVKLETPFSDLCSQKETLCVNKHLLNNIKSETVTCNNKIEIGSVNEREFLAEDAVMNVKKYDSDHEMDKKIEIKPEPWWLETKTVSVCDDVKATCKCKYNCKDLLKEQKELLFQRLYKLANEDQGTYLMNLIDIVPIARRRHGTYSHPADSKRQATMCYSVPSGKGLVQVCAKTFKEIFALTNRRLQTLNMKKKQGSVTYSDERGKIPSSHAHKVKYTEEVSLLVQEHIKSFPTEESHYGRKRSTKLYLSPDLNIHRMYQAFKLKYPGTQVPYAFYRRVFNKDFRNIASHKRRTDTYHVCDKLNCQLKYSGTNKSEGTTIFVYITENLKRP